MIIDGSVRPASSGAWFTSDDPATDAVLAYVSEAGDDDVDDAVAAARRALNGPWSKMGGAARGRIIQRMAAAMRERTEELCEIESLDAGKPFAATTRMDIPAAIDCLEYFAGWADKLTGDVVPTRAGVFSGTVRVAVGVVGAIVPWNFPLMNAVWKLAPALAAGCTIVLKPAELTPLSALWLGQLALDAGLPPGVLNIVPGYGPVTGAALVAHTGIDKIAFTGSPEVGRSILRAAADDFKRVGLELGGKSASVVFADADLTKAAKQTALGAFFNAGQVCSAATRVLVDRTVHDEFAERLAEHARAIVLGTPADPKTRMGPLISRKQLERVLGHVAGATQEGASVLYGACRQGEVGNFVVPGILTGVSPKMAIAREEVFGPVLSIIPFSSEDEAYEIANGTDYSLASAVWTDSAVRAHRAFGAMRAGTVWINTYGPTDTRLPWGGMGGRSGFGRDLGTVALHSYCETKTFWFDAG